MFRIDTPAHIERRYNREDTTGYVILAVLAAMAAAIGCGGAALLLLGGTRRTDHIGAALCMVWALAWTVAMRWAVRRRARDHAAIRRWQITPQIGYSEVVEAHLVYAKLSTDAQINYGFPLIKRLYELSTLDIRGEVGQRKILAQMRERAEVLRRLVDAEDKLRLYALDPRLADRDDIAAAKLWQQAAAAADRYLRHPEL